MGRRKGSEALAEVVQDIAPADGDTLPFDFRESPGYVVNLLSRLVTSDYLQRIDHTGIAPAQAYVLGELWREAPLSQVELSRRLDIGKATVGQTLARLERAGLVRRLRVESDRRVVMVGLTEKGRGLRDILNAAAWEQLATMREAIGDDALDQLTALAGKLADALRRRGATTED